ncbi:MAG TPA: 50S ribosomal protein L19 [Candidatus Paceibacterota bacterium]
MTNLIQYFNSNNTVGKELPDIRPGQTIKVHQKIKDGNKTRTQVFEGIVIARKHGSGPNATITVRKISNGIGVERIFPIHMPNVEKFEIMRSAKVRRSKLYYLRTKSARETRKKTKLIQTKSKKITAEPTTINQKVTTEK